MKNSRIINKTYNKSFILSKVLHRLPVNQTINKKYNVFRHRQIIKKITPILEEAYSNTLNNELVGNNTASQKIWIFWWQGSANMPLLVKKCYQSIKKNSGKKQVILITKDNIHKYSAIPSYIYEKVSKGEISLTHLSDILRFNLLSKTGGLWIDATVYVTSSLDVFDTKKLLTCGGYSKDGYFNVSCGRWTGFFIGGPEKLELFNFMNNFFEIYWKYNDKLIDYFLIDYALNFAWNKNISNFRSSEKEYQNIAPRMFDLQKKLNDEFDQQYWDQLLKNTTIFKLSYKKKINLNDNNNYFSNL